MVTVGRKPRRKTATSTTHSGTLVCGLSRNDWWRTSRLWWVRYPAATTRTAARRMPRKLRIRIEPWSSQPLLAIGSVLEHPLLLQLLAVDAVARPGHRLKARQGDRVAAVDAGAIGPVLHPRQRLLDLEQELALAI